MLNNTHTHTHTHDIRDKTGSNKGLSAQISSGAAVNKACQTATLGAFLHEEIEEVSSSSVRPQVTPGCST